LIELNEWREDDMKTFLKIEKANNIKRQINENMRKNKQTVCYRENNQRQRGNAL
jgi:hypothetical protein